MKNKVQVSVCMITYKHESFIVQAIESILNQKTNFDYELIISNDASSDRSDQLIKTIKNSHPEGHRITYFYQSDNLGMHQNFIFALGQCQGKYIALCEGDDYWIDHNKLQRQVDFLESHPDYEVCFTNISIVNETGELLKEKLITDDRKDIYTEKDMPIWSPTLTRVFKNRDFSEVLKSAPGLDTLMLTYQSKFGKIKFLNEVTGSYRLHKEGIYSSKSDALKKQHIIETHFECLKIIDKKFLLRYFGMILKKALELKRLDVKMYRKNRINIIQNYHRYKPELGLINRIKFKLGVALLNSPMASKFIAFDKLVFKFLNKFFIY
ncbi:MAG: glycosyltransferase [Saprospiraceae bacterium]|nr:glycosyltransferase [Saprospiraceae bacterium]